MGSTRSSAARARACSSEHISRSRAASPAGSSGSVVAGTPVVPQTIKPWVATASPSTASIDRLSNGRIAWALFHHRSWLPGDRTLMPGNRSSHARSG